MGDSKYQNLKQMLSGTQANPFGQQDSSQEQKQKEKNKVRLNVSEFKNRYDSDDLEDYENQTTTTAQNKAKQSGIKPNIHSYIQNNTLYNVRKSKLNFSSTNQLDSYNDTNTLTLDKQNSFQNKKGINNFQQFMNNMSSVGNKNSDSYAISSNSLIDMQKKNSQNDSKQILQQSHRKLSQNDKVKVGFGLGMLNSPSGASSTHYQNSSNSETIKSSSQSPIKLAFKEKLNIQPPTLQSQKQITSLRSIPNSPLTLGGLNKVLIKESGLNGERNSGINNMNTSARRLQAISNNEQQQEEKIFYKQNSGISSLAQLGGLLKKDSQESSSNIQSQSMVFQGRRPKKYLTANPTLSSIQQNSYTMLPDQNIREEMTEHFKTTINLIDMNENKKYEFKDSPISANKHIDNRKVDKFVIYKPNIPSIDQVLNIGKINLLQLGVNDFTYFCIRVKGEQSPLRVKINQDKILNYKIMVSREYPTPSQFNCDYNLQGSVFSFESENNTGYFSTQQYYYFAIYSNEEAIIRLQVSFGNNFETFKFKNNQTSSSNSLTQNDQTAPKQEYKLSCTDLSNKQLREEVKSIIEKRRRKIGAIGFDTNVIQKNIENLKAENLTDQKVKKKQMIENKKVKIQQAQDQKLQIWENHLTQLAAQKEEKESKKQEKILEKMIEIKKFQKKTFDFIWITNIIMILATKKLADKLQRHKQRQRLMRDMAFSLLRPFFRYKTRARKIGGQNIHLRVLLEARYAMGQQVLVKKQKVKEQAKNILISCLKQNAQRFLNIKNAVTYARLSRKVAEKFYCFHLLYRYWEKHYYELINQILEVKIDQATQKNASLSKRVTQNVQQSFNHIDHKRNALENFYQRNLQKYREVVKKLLKQPDGFKSQRFILNVNQLNSINKTTNSIYYHQLFYYYLSKKKEHDIKLSSQTSIQVNLKDLSKEQQNVNSDEESKQNTEQDIDSSKQKIGSDKYELPRIFAIPTREQFKAIIFEAVLSICHSYPDLSKKVSLKYSPF